MALLAPWWGYVLIIFGMALSAKLFPPKPNKKPCPNCGERQVFNFDELRCSNGVNIEILRCRNCDAAYAIGSNGEWDRDEGEEWVKTINQEIDPQWLAEFSAGGDKFEKERSKGGRE